MILTRPPREKVLCTTMCVSVRTRRLNSDGSNSWSQKKNSTTDFVLSSIPFSI